MDLTKQIEEVAVSLFLPIVRANTAQNGYFRAVISVSVDGEVKPLLLLGNAHGDKEDGNCAAILNPDRALCDTLNPVHAGSGRILKELVAGRCDAMVPLWIDAYKKAGGVVRGARYKARKPMPAKFEVE